MPAARITTGSGGIRAQRLAAHTFDLSTGSGSVRVELTTDVQIGRIDTGSGGVDVAIAPDAGAEITIDTGSGGIDVQVPGFTVNESRRSFLRVSAATGLSAGVAASCGAPDGTPRVAVPQIRLGPELGAVPTPAPPPDTLLHFTPDQAADSDVFAHWTLLSLGCPDFPPVRRMSTRPMSRPVIAVPRATISFRAARACSKTVAGAGCGSPPG